MQALRAKGAGFIHRTPPHEKDGGAMSPFISLASDGTLLAIHCTWFNLTAHHHNEPIPAMLNYC